MKIRSAYRDGYLLWLFAMLVVAMLQPFTVDAQEKKTVSEIQDV